MPANNASDEVLFKCNTCGLVLDTPTSICSAGKHPTRIPSNVLLAAEDETHLVSRLDVAKQACSELEQSLLDDVQVLVKRNLSVSVNMHPHTLLELFQDERVRYVNLHDTRKAGAVIDYPPDLSAKRLGIDTLVFGLDGDKLNFGALNLGGIGAFSYGAACVFLNDEQIRPSVSFLEKNSFSYLSQSGGAVKLDIPHGVRALWSRVSTLVIVKHLKDLLVSTTWKLADLARLILFSEGDKKTDNYIEAQISFPITQKCIKRIVFDPTLDRKATPNTLEGRAAIVSRDALTSLLKSGIPGIESEIRGSSGVK